MSQRPQTLYGIDDSPIGLAAWMLDHDARSYELIARVFNDKQEGLSEQPQLFATEMRAAFRSLR